MRTSPLQVKLNNCLTEYQRQLNILRDYQEGINTRGYLLSQKLHDDERKKWSQSRRLDAGTEGRLKAETKKEKRILQNDLTVFLKEAPPQALVALHRQKNLLSRVSPYVANRLRAIPWALLETNGYAHLDEPAGPMQFQLTPPAMASEPMSPFISAELGELNLHIRSSGLGGAWGLGATARPSPAYGSLTFIFQPPVSGDLHVKAQVTMSGTVYVAAHDHWYTSTDGIVKITLGCRLFQSYIDAGPPLVIVDEHRWDDSAAYWVIDTFTPTASTTVIKEIPVLVDVWVSIEASGRSDHALVEADFRSGADKYIRVPSIDLTLIPL
jgi:hypothetical protein